MTMGLAPPAVLVEQHAGEHIRRWFAHYCFDTTDDGRLEPLPIFDFTLRINDNQFDKRPYRLYEGNYPSGGGQYHYDVESAEARALAVVLSYAHHRRDSIYSHHQKLKHELYRKLAQP